MRDVIPRPLFSLLKPNYLQLGDDVKNSHVKEMNRYRSALS